MGWASSGSSRTSSTSSRVSRSLSRWRSPMPSWMCSRSAMPSSGWTTPDVLHGRPCTRTPRVPCPMCSGMPWERCPERMTCPVCRAIYEADEDAAEGPHLSRVRHAGHVGSTAGRAVPRDRRRDRRLPIARGTRRARQAALHARAHARSGGRRVVALPPAVTAPEWQRIWQAYQARGGRRRPAPRAGARSRVSRARPGHRSAAGPSPCRMKQHGSSPIIGAERHAIALAAAFGVQRTAHASSAITGVDLRSVGAGISAGTIPPQAGVLGLALKNARQRTRSFRTPRPRSPSPLVYPPLLVVPSRSPRSDRVWSGW